MTGPGIFEKQTDIILQEAALPYRDWILGKAPQRLQLFPNLTDLPSNCEPSGEGM